MSSAAVLFDLDGTLIDSAPDLHAAAARMLEAEGQAPLPFEIIRSFIGNGVPKLVERIIGVAGLDMAEHPRLVSAFMAEYDAHSTDLTRPYPGVADALARFRTMGYGLGVVTNKPEASARNVLAALRLAEFFPVVIGGDSLPERKPDPSGVLTAMEQLGASATVYVGDSEVDSETAGRADLPFLLFTEGYRKSPVFQIPHQLVFDRFDGLPALVEPLVSTQRLV
ncbi:phosphoglycolate phosphatase [Mangrovicoccus algicola]|uniref:Phosphoglycolate phosphatase n=1 Tax=Mangrovicoccus algicola TaxID=2771008 RepID=A0A8J7CZH9_9RHOB|nr:phosphoglycolate phosphatase [Mangrovicoccus algicola]MBE3637903.1 phosphoglycolate phosphatase [Mangrovicoccus algicola]